MKTKQIILLSILALTLLFASLRTSQTLGGPHGGKVKPAGDFNIEMRGESAGFFVYLLDKKCNPLSNKGVSGDVEFQFPDSVNIHIPLIPYGEDGFCTESGAPRFYSCRIQFKVFGKSVSAWFENENPIVRSK